MTLHQQFYNSHLLIVYPDLTTIKGSWVKLADIMESLEKKPKTALKTH